MPHARLQPHMDVTSRVVALEREVTGLPLLSGGPGRSKSTAFGVR
jgi:hypothetical protein